MPGVEIPTTLTVFLALIVLNVEAQFPATCVRNATLPDSICCPTPPGFTEPCGGLSRGRCVRVQPMDDLRDVPEVSQIDDRFDWPTKFFKNVCSCYGNFSGYMCHECWYGNKGPDCTERKRAVRKEVSRMTPEERDSYISALAKSMTVESDYMILNTSHSSDPTTEPQFLKATVYQYFAHLHYYASRQTNFGNDSVCDSGGNMFLDFAHEGPTFPIWHRVYSLKWEQALRKISGDENFVFPYWDWIDGGGSCKVCINEWFGSRNQSDPAGTLNKQSVFSAMRVMCKRPENGCQVCDPYVDAGPLTRKPGEDPRFPNQETRKAVDYTMALTTYDLDPFSSTSPKIAFRNAFEGFASADGVTTTNSSMHNLIHRYLNGTMTDVATAALDPIFLVHHNFLDKLFEIWRLKNKAMAQVIPVVGAQPGHNRNSYLVPFFPPVQAFSFFQDTENLGYKYDNLNVDDTMPDDNGSDSGHCVPFGYGVLAGIGIGIVVVFVIGCCVWKIRKKKSDNPGYLMGQDNRSYEGSRA